MNRSIFNTVERQHIPYNGFDMSYQHRLTCEFGEIVPVHMEELLPGDKYNYNVEALIRCAPMIAPLMDEVEVCFHTYEVPLRILWPEFTDWIIGKSASEWPHMIGNHNWTEGELSDYLGYVKAPDGNYMEYSAFPVAAYAKIYDEYYRDQNLVVEISQDLTAGRNIWCETLYTSEPKLAAWRHDYFTAALPTRQLGSEVTLPITQQSFVDVVSKGSGNVTGQIVRGVSDFVAATADDMVISGTGEIHVGAQGRHHIDPNGDLEVLINTVASTITTVRTAFALQRYLEKTLRSGTRYTEWNKGIFGVYTSDGRLQRPEYVGGSKGYISFSEIVSSAQTIDQSSNDVPIGQYAGHGISGVNGNNISGFAEEHGLLMTVMIIRPKKAGYHQGVKRMFTRDTYDKYFIPDFQNVGEQEILVKEIWVEQTMLESKSNETWAYIPKYAEYKSRQDEISGEMNSSMESFHLSRDFATEPVLNQSFIECVPDKSRIFNVIAADEDCFYVHVYNRHYMQRKMQVFGNAGNIIG